MSIYYGIKRTHTYRNIICVIFLLIFVILQLIVIGVSNKYITFYDTLNWNLIKIHDFIFIVSHDD